MEIKTANVKRIFAPVVITITIETQEEADSFSSYKGMLTSYETVPMHCLVGIADILGEIN